MAEFEDISEKATQKAKSFGLSALGLARKGLDVTSNLFEEAEKALREIDPKTCKLTTSGALTKSNITATGETDEGSLVEISDPQEELLQISTVSVPEFRYSGRVKSPSSDIAEKIPIDIKADKDDRDISYFLQISSKGLWLCFEEEMFIEEKGLLGFKKKEKAIALNYVEEFKVGNCEIFSKGLKFSKDSLHYAKKGAAFFGKQGAAIGAGIATSALKGGAAGALVGVAAGAVLGGAVTLASMDKKFYIRIETIDGLEHIFQLSSQEDGEKLIEAIDELFEFSVAN